MEALENKDKIPNHQVYSSVASLPENQVFNGQTSVVARAKIFPSLSHFSLAYVISIQYLRM